PTTPTLSLHDALPIYPHVLRLVPGEVERHVPEAVDVERDRVDAALAESRLGQVEPDKSVDGERGPELLEWNAEREVRRGGSEERSEEHTSELQSRSDL